MLITTSLLHVYVFLWYKKKILNKEFVSLCLLQTMIAFYFLFMVATARAATPESCRDLLQGYLTGRLSSAVGGNQIEALRRQIRTNNDVMTKTINELKKQFKADLQMIRGVFWFRCLKYNIKAKKIYFNQITCFVFISLMLSFLDTRNKTVVYTRWGKKTCPSNAELVLSGKNG